MVETLRQTLNAFRPAQPTGTSGVMSFVNFKIYNVKLDCPKDSPTVDGSGRMQSHTGTLFFNIGKSTTIPEQTQVLKPGDYLSTDLSATTPPAQRYVVKSVRECFQKGVLHHLEADLA